MAVIGPVSIIPSQIWLFQPDSFPGCPLTYFWAGVTPELPVPLPGWVWILLVGEQI